MTTPKPRSGHAVLADLAQERRQQAEDLRALHVRMPHAGPALAWRRAALAIYRRSFPRPHRIRARDLREVADKLRAYARAPWVDELMAAYDPEEDRRLLAGVVACELARAWGVLVNSGQGRCLARGR